MLALLFCLLLPVLFIADCWQKQNWGGVALGFTLLGVLLYNIWDGSDWG